MRFSLFCTVAVAVCAMLSPGDVRAAGRAAQVSLELTQRGHITLYPIHFGDPVAAGIAAGPDGAMWYADFGDNSIGRVTLSGKITEYPDGLNGPNGIVAGPDGALWFTETTSQSIGRITVGGKIAHFGHALHYPQSITSGPDGALWFSAFAHADRITTSGSITRFKLGPKRTEFEGITTGPDGALWVTRYVDDGSRFSDKVVRLTTSGMMSAYAVGYGPHFITAGPDGALWLTESGAGKIGRLTTAGHLTEFPLRSSFVPVGIAAGPDGALWFTVAQGGSFIGRITVSGRITLYRVPRRCSSPQQIAAGPDRAMWFTCGAYIGRTTT